jgi:hypothetical protein
MIKTAQPELTLGTGVCAVTQLYQRYDCDTINNQTFTGARISGTVGMEPENQEYPRCLERIRLVLPESKFSLTGWRHYYGLS